MKKRQKNGSGDTRMDAPYTDRLAKICNFSIFGSTQSSLLSVISSDLKRHRKIWIATVNPEFVMQTRKDEFFLNILKTKTTFNVVDGVGLVWASKTKNIFQGVKVGVEILMGRHRENLITGADLMDKLCQVAAKKGQTVYFFGGWSDRSEKTAKYFLKKYPALKVVGYRAEDFDFKTKVDYLFVARAMKKQELWIDQNYQKLEVGLVMGVGRSFDYYSGVLKRAPMWVRKMGMEWLFSLIMEPKRWRRQLELPKFIWMVLNSH